MRAKCPNCGTRIAPPARYTLLGPFWPFGQWRCHTCKTPLRFRVVSYFVSSIPAIVVAMIYLLPFGLLGGEGSPWALAVLPVYLIAAHWSTVHLASVDAVR